jgi:hypothetical protein
VDESRARVETEPGKPTARAAASIVVRHGDVERDAFEVLRRLGAADRPIVLRAAVGRAEDQRPAELVPQRLQLVEGRLVHEQLAGAAAISAGEKFGQRQAAVSTSRQLM